MDINKRYTLITKNTEEVVTRQELKALLADKTTPHAYWGFECSGQ